MRIIVWNVRGMGNDPAIRGLLDLQKREDPDVIFLSEIKMKGCVWIGLDGSWL
jgi:exonuclease III